MKLGLILGAYFVQANNIFDMITRVGTENGFFPSFEATKSYMPPIEYSEIKRLSFYASTVHCPETEIITTWTCQSCSENSTFISSFEHDLLGTRGMIVTTPDSIILTFRGTENIQNWMLDFKAMLVPYPVIPDPLAKVHLGFLQAMTSLAPSFLEELRNLRSKPKYKNHEIIVVGHSLGGAISTLAAILINYEFNLQWKKIKLVTYGQPRTGNAHFAHWLDIQPLATARVVYENDLVPHIIPSLFKFAHHHNEIYIHNDKPRYCKTNVLEDPDCSHKVIPLAYSHKDHMGYFKHISTEHCIKKIPIVDLI